MDLPSYEEAIKQPVEEGRAAKFCRQVCNHDFFLFEIMEAGSNTGSRSNIIFVFLKILEAHLIR